MHVSPDLSVLIVNSPDPSEWFMLFTTMSAAVDVGNLM